MPPPVNWADVSASRAALEEVATWRELRALGRGAPEFRRQLFVRRTLNPDDALRDRMAAADALSQALLADRDRHGLDYAAGAGY